MSTVSTTGSVQQTTSTQTTANALSKVDMDQFLKLLISQLENQDPLDPMDNSEMLQQISQMRDISAMTQLSETLQSVRLGQDMATASSLIGKHIHALSDTAEDVEGTVDRVSLETDENDESQHILRVHVGDQEISLDNIRDILGE